MTVELKGNYFLRLKFGDQDIQFDPSNIKEFSIIQDIDRFLPSFRLNTMDTQGEMAHVLPFDKAMSRISVEVSPAIGEDISNSFEFYVYRRMPESGYSTAVSYDIEGLLATDGLFAPSYSRSWGINVSDVLSSIATSELKVDSTEISPSLAMPKHMVQPNFTNSQFLTDLKYRLYGMNGETSYKIFIKRYNGKSVFVCRPLTDFYADEIKYKFIVNDNQYEDNFPIFEYSIFDNYKLYGAFGSKQQRYSWFDYANGAYTENTINTDDYLSLSQYLAIDGNDTADSVIVDNNGCGDIFGQGQNAALANHHNRLSYLVNMWILTVGLENVVPGDIVQVLFAQGINSGSMFSYQYSGYWMVRRVVHTFGRTHKTRLLLARSGMDTDQKTSLLRAAKKKA